MPNWCENELSVSGPAEELKEFREFANPLSANKLIPMPEEFKDIETGLTFIDGVKYTHWRTVEGKAIPVSEEEKKALHEKYGACHAIDWAHMNWGTIWDFIDCKVEEHSNMVVYRFDTAWGPPVPVIENIAEMYPNLSFLFSFGGIEINSSGSIFYVKGERNLLKHIEYRTGFYVEDLKDLDYNFSDKYSDSLRKAFPEMYSGTKHVAIE